MSGMRIFVLQRSRSGSVSMTTRRRRALCDRSSVACTASVVSEFHAAPTCMVLHSRIHPDRSFSSFRFFGTVPPSSTDKDDNKKQTPSLAPTNKQEELLNNWLRQLKSPPNIITTARILSSPILSYCIITQHYDWALYGCFAAGISDWLDGFLAKHYNMGTVLGTYLDPLADKIVINVLSLSLWYSDILPTPLIVLWLGRDVALTGATYLYVSAQTKAGRFVVDPVRTPLKVEPTTISKINTVFQFLTLGVGMLQPGVCGAVPPPAGVLELLW